MKKTVVITGALGFIGSHTAKIFKNLDWTVIGIDREYTIPQATKFIDHLIVGDFLDHTVTAAIVSQASAIVHCAGNSLVGPSLSSPGDYYHNNCAKTNQMLDLLAKNKWTGAIVFSSSAAVYGMPLSSDSLCETQAKNPISPYGWSKLICERMIEDHCKASSFKGIALRYFNASGCDHNGHLGHSINDTHLIPRILDACINDQPFTVYGTDYQTKDGTCIRDYLHVSDIAKAHVIAVVKSQEFSPGHFQAYNLGTGSGYSNLEIFSMCEQITGKKINLIKGPRRSGDPDFLVANSELFQKDTTWRPISSNLENIVKTAWLWHQNYHTST